MYVLTCWIIYRYKVPFLEIVGFTSTWKNYTLAGAFLAHEAEENYTWAVKPCMVTDREKALMNPLDRLFSNTKHLLCRRHIEKNIEARARQVMRSKADAKFFSNDYWVLFKETTQEGYTRELRRIEAKWQTRKSLLQYVRSQWLEPYKTRIVSAWTDTIFTCRNRCCGLYAPRNP